MEVDNLRVTKKIITEEEDTTYKLTIQKGDMKIEWTSPNELPYVYGDELKLKVEKLNSDLSKYEEDED